MLWIANPKIPLDLTMEPNEITLHFEGGTDLIINCAENGSNPADFICHLAEIDEFLTNLELLAVRVNIRETVYLTSAPAKLRMINHGMPLKCTITPLLLRFKVMNALLEYLVS